MIQNKRAKIKQDIGDAPLNNLRLGTWGLSHYCLFFIYISYSYLQIQYIDAIIVPFCILQQLLKLMATNLNANMTSAYKILSYPDKCP